LLFFIEIGIIDYKAFILQKIYFIMNEILQKNNISSWPENTFDILNIFSSDICATLNLQQISPKDIEKNIEYIDDKLCLYSNLKEHFDSVINLKNILSLYMILYQDYDDKSKLQQIFKQQLIAAWVFDNQEILEFCLLISEKKRSFKNFPSWASDEEIGKYYFDSYSTHEKWAAKNFNFFLKNNHSYQTKKNRVLEEVALKIIIQSRANMTEIIRSPDPKNNRNDS